MNEEKMKYLSTETLFQPSKGNLCVLACLSWRSAKCSIVIVSSVGIFTSDFTVEEGVILCVLWMMHEKHRIQAMTLPSSL